MNLALQILFIAFQVVVIVGLADFAAGLVPWEENAYFDERIPGIGAHIIVSNIVHHQLSRYVRTPSSRSADKSPACQEQNGTSQTQ